MTLLTSVKDSILTCVITQGQQWNHHMVEGRGTQKVYNGPRAAFDFDLKCYHTTLAIEPPHGSRDKYPMDTR